MYLPGTLKKDWIKKIIKSYVVSRYLKIISLTKTNTVPSYFEKTNKNKTATTKHVRIKLLHTQKKILPNSRKPLFWCVIELYTAWLSNVYLYSTLTTHSASISDYNHDVNLFLFMAYYFPSFTPSFIIFWRLLLSIRVQQLICSTNSTKGRKVGLQNWRKARYCRCGTSSVCISISHQCFLCADLESLTFLF